MNREIGPHELDKDQKTRSLRLMGKHIKNPDLKRVFHELDNKTVETELQLLSEAVKLTEEYVETQAPESMFTNIQKLLHHLPIPFQFPSKFARNEWNKSLLSTIEIVDQEIKDDYYRKPSSLEDVELLRYYLFDGYARFITTHTTSDLQKTSDHETPRNIAAEREYADIVTNALCEAVYILAGQNNEHARIVKDWMHEIGWFNESYGFSSEFAQKVLEEYKDKSK